MGCDIHMMAEIRRKERENAEEVEKYGDEEQKWEAVTEQIFTNLWYDAERAAKYDWMTEKQVAPYDGRNYKLFGFLADVRNGYGFAGVDTGEAIKPIESPRGVPRNASKDWKAEVYDWGGDMHSQSYFTLAELEAADWEQPVTSRYYVSPAAYIAYRDDGTEPEMTWGGGSGVHVTAAEFENMADEDREQVHGVQIQDVKPMKELAGSFYTTTLKELAELADKEGVSHDEIRIVFGFDN